LEISFPKEGIMVLGDMLERFILDAPMPVLFRLLRERALDPQEVDRMFESTATRQYTRELLFSAIVDLIAVVCRRKPSVRRAYLDSSGIAAPLTAVYEKLKGAEPQVCRALVQTTAQRLAEVVRQLEPDRPASLRGYRVKVFDGHHLAAPQHRIPETRAVEEAVLPGQTLVVYDLDLGLVVDAVPCEDAHAQERTLLAAMLAGCAPGDLWVGDRNFEVSRRRAYFLVRQHSTAVHVEPLDQYVVIGRTATGEVQEQRVLVVAMDGPGRPRRDEQGQAQEMEMRRLRVLLDEPTQDGEGAILLLTNVPAGDADALVLSQLYLRRWTIEVMHYNAKQMMGLEDPANRTAQAVERTAPVGLALYGLTLFWFHREGHRSLSYPDRPWYPGKDEPSYADILAALRRESWRGQFPGVDWERGGQETLLARLIEFASRPAQAALRHDQSGSRATLRAVRPPDPVGLGRSPTVPIFCKTRT
jgi:hypothetical protein